MNAGLAYWGGLFGLLTVEMGLVLAVAAVMQRWTKSTAGRRLVWQVALLAAALVLLGEIVGFRRVPATPQPQALSPRRVTARVVDEITPPSTLLSSELTESQPVLPAPAIATTWWPGWLWLAGTGILALRGLASRLWLTTRPKRSHTADPQTLAIVAQLSRPLALRAVQVRIWPGLRGPIAFGTFQPTIALPADFQSRFTPEQRGAMLAHELAHLAAHDPTWLALADVICALAWWHSGVWWARRRLQASCEAHADAASALVPGGRTALAESLVAFGRELANPGLTRGLGVAGGSFKSELAQRITALLNGPGAWPAKPPRWRWAVSAAAVLFAGTLLQVSWPGSGSPALGSLIWAHARAARAAADPTTPATNQDFVGDTNPNSRSAEGRPADTNLRTNQVVFTAGRQRVLDKLQRINVSALLFHNSTLEEIVKWLREESKTADPAGTGVNFLIAGRTPALAIDPTTGKAVPDSAPNQLRFTIELLQGMPLLGALKVIVQQAPEPIQFTVEDYAVVFSRWTPPAESSPAEPLYTRSFQVNSDTFIQAVQTVAKALEGLEPAPSGPTRTTKLQPSIREFFRAAGVEFAPLYLPGDDWHTVPVTGERVPENRKAIFFNDATGTLFVRATMADLDLVEAALNTLNLPSPGPKQASPAGPPKSTPPPDASAADEPVGTRIATNVAYYIPPASTGAVSTQPQPATAPTNPSNELRSQLAIVEATLAELRTRYKDKHPKVVEVARHVEELKLRLAELEKSLVTPPGSVGSKSVYVPLRDPDPPRESRSPAVTLEVKLVEIAEGGDSELGLDWLFGQARTNNAPVTLEGPTGDLPGAGSTNAVNVRVSRQRIEGQSATISPVQFAALMKQLEARSRVDILSAPRITTGSGRQAQIAVQDVRTIVTGVETQDAKGAGDARINYVTQDLRTGPLVDVVPWFEDGQWRLEVTGRVTEFLGYDDPTGVKVEAKTASGKPVKATMPLPHLRVREVSASGHARPGETLLLRGPLSDETLRMVDKVPVLGDIPLAGRLFRTESTETLRKRLYIFITPQE